MFGTQVHKQPVIDPKLLFLVLAVPPRPLLPRRGGMNPPR